MAKQTDDALYTEWYENIMTELEQGRAPWVKPWNDGGLLPCNALTGRNYNGLNVFLLGMVAERNGWPARWLTPGSAIKLSKRRKIRVNFKGQKTTTVNHYRPVFKEDETTGDRTFAGIKVTSWKLLNVAQVQGLPEDVAKGPETKALPESDRNSKAEAFFAKIGARVEHGKAGAFYSPNTDHIGMPDFASFVDAARYYATLAHEHVHWTGHASRLGRPIANPFGSMAYAKEELIAEFGAAFVCAQLGINGQLQHPEYIGHWLKVLYNDKGVALRAAKRAQRAARWLLEAGGLVEPYQQDQD